MSYIERNPGRTFLIAVLALGALIFYAEKCSAQDAYVWLEPQVSIEKVARVDSSVRGGRDYKSLGTGEYFGTISYGKQWSHKLGLFLQTSHGNEWGETVLGPQFQFGNSIQLGVGVGMEHYSPRPVRARLNAYYDDADTGSFAYIQYDIGHDSSWVWADATRMYKWFGIGGLVQMPGGGGGMKVEVRPTKHIGLWVAPVYDWRADVVRTLVGGRLMFDMKK